LAKFDIVAVIDADYIVEEGAFYNCLRYFEDSSVVAVSGILKTMNAEKTVL
jgi:cellulose synthase/poly-beta-1,6-N-acetylglucosamine synthase-like glycosyltransferase